MGLKHIFDDSGRHKLLVVGQEHENLGWTSYQLPATLMIGERLFIATTNYYSGYLPAIFEVGKNVRGGDEMEV
jgi:hypothetical protein